MREYGQIQCSYWQRVIEEGWSTDATLLGAYLLTGPHSNGIGTYRLPLGYIQDDLSWERDRVRETLSELFEKGFCKAFGGVIHIPKFLRWNPISNGNVAKARVRDFEAIPNDDAKAAAALVLIEFGNHWPKGFINRLETLSKGLSKQNPTRPIPNPIENLTTSEDKSSSVDAPASKSLAERIWGEGLDTLSRLSGKPAAKLRSLVGKWRKDYGDEATFGAIVEAERQAVTEPVAWVTRALAARAGSVEDDVPDYVRGAT